MPRRQGIASWSRRSGVAISSSDATAWSSEHDSALGRWSYVWQRASPPLRGLVAGYVGYRQRLSVPAVHRGIPAATLPLVLNLGPTMTIGQPGSGRPPTRAGSFLAGMHDRYVLIDAEEHHGIQVELGPLAAVRLFGRPLGELTSEIVDLDHVLGPDAGGGGGPPPPPPPALSGPPPPPRGRRGAPPRAPRRRPGRA
jgi:hypothetical protein